MNTIQQYRAEVTLSPSATGQKEATVSINTPDQNTAKKLVDRLLGDGATFAQQKEGTQFIYHPDVNNGKEPCGWINQMAVPQGLDVKATTKNRLERELVAA